MRNYSFGPTHAVKGGEIYMADIQRTQHAIDNHILVGKRPVVILQSERQVRNKIKVIIAKVTTNDMMTAKPDNMLIYIDPGKPSFILFEEVSIIPKSDLMEKIGELTKQERIQAFEMLHNLLTVGSERED